ncbi:cellulase family glycosylhydrolase [Streptomyces sp. GSL17-111]|uniref:cellulase family glycosylhydrolase n=1 Tax=Streptomyces sp. GSL17-111 TaxID=3121596 RepID=UPI0030F3EC96
MRRKLAVAAGAILAMATTALAAPPAAQAADDAAASPGFHVGEGRLLDANGEDFVLRGVNHAHTWYPDSTPQALADIKALGANSARVVLSSGDQWTRNDVSDVAAVVRQCKDNRLICVLEVHDTTGYGEAAAAVPLSRAVDYWIDVQDAVKGQEKYVILNLGNEPYGNTGYENWTAGTTDALQRMRAAGFEHTLMADAPNWGQDWSSTMLENAPGVFSADPDRNTVFSIHMYGVYETESAVRDYLNRFVSRGLPIVVGEFGDAHSDGNPDEDAIMATAREFGVGYLGWSWSGNGGGVEYLDMASDFDASRLTAWGQRFFHGPDGIGETSREASVYRGGGGDTEAPTAPGTPTAADVTSSSATLSWPAATDDTGVTAYDVVRIDGARETRVAGSATTTATVGGLDPATDYVFAVYARDAAGNRSERSAGLAVSTPEGPVGGDCRVSYRLSDWGSSFNADVTVHNTGSRAIDGWELAFAFGGDQRVGHAWNARVTQDGSAVRAGHESWTRTIPAGGSVSFGFNGSSGGGNEAPESFTLNGSRCTTG